ncbi:MAG TPA: hypothetical protein VEF76_10860 [Patescibacteria group bacterium]|nr:hypothetical protein [Patescibacteria group bacterium]
MKLSSIFLGAALVWGGMTGPGIYHEVKQDSETVRATVTGIVETQPNGGKQSLEIHTTAGTFNTYQNLDGTPIVKGLTYDFNLQGAHIQPWPATYTRDIKGVHLVTPLDNLLKKGPAS